MDQSSTQHYTTKRRMIIARILFLGIMIAFLAMLFIIIRRGYMNYNNRMDFISRRLDDYPHMLQNYRKETEEMQELWLTSNYQKRAEQAALLYRWNEKGQVETEKLDEMAEMLRAARIIVIPADQKENVIRDIDEKKYDVAFAPLPGDRLIVLEIEKSEEFQELRTVEYTAFLSQLAAGMPGYMLVMRDGALSIYPQDESSQAILGMVQSMIDSNALNTDTLKAEAAQSKNGITFVDAMSEGTDSIPKGSYVLRCAAYATLDDIVIFTGESEDLVRYGRKRTWSLVVLTLSVFLFLSLALWRTKLFIPEEDPKTGRIIAFRRCGLAFLLACLVLLFCVLDIQELSAVNQSQDSTFASAVFLHNILEKEAERAQIISDEFDEIYQKRAEVAARALSRNPEMIVLDSLKELDESLDGIRLRVYDTSGNLIASDDLYHQNVSGNDQETEPQERVYRMPMLDDNARTTGFVTLHASQAKLDALLVDTRIEEVLNDLHIVDSLRVIAVDKDDKLTITAASLPNWIGDSAPERGIPSNILYDGYEGVLVMDGDQMYCVVFSYQNNLILVASRDVSPLVFLEGIAPLALGLLLLLFVLYVVMIHGLYDLQALNAQAGIESRENLPTFPPLKDFMRNFMISLFALSVVLYMITNGNTSSLTYNMLRGVWVRGINVVTVTTCIMAISGIVTFFALLSVILKHVSRYLRPKGRTICHLIDSASHYFSAIFLIVYALSLFGVDTATLLGGAGVIALMFTLGANSLISNVLAGFFIIFEGNIMVGDVVTIGDFRGVVTDISMRTTKLMDDNTQDIKIISNSQISELVNQSRMESYIAIDIKISHDIGLIEGERIVREALKMLPPRCPEIIGTPKYLGVVDLPQRNQISGKILSTTVRVCVTCRERDREYLTYRLNRELVWVAHRLLNDDSQIGIEGCQVVDPLVFDDVSEETKSHD